jgi:tetratricopeptide (TPR) repeat protein
MRSLSSAHSNSADSLAADFLQLEAAAEPELALKLSLKLKKPRSSGWLSPSDTDLLLSKGASWQLQQRNYSAAIEILNRLIAYNPHAAKHYANRGLVYACDRQWQAALADYNQAIALDPQLDSVYNNRANFYAMKRDWLSALADYDQAIDLNPLNIRARLNQAITFREMHDYEEALACLDIAMFLRPQSATLYAERGRVYHLRGDWNCAITDYTTALNLTLLPCSNALSDHRRVNHRVTAWMSSFRAAR